jgi:undecaprenyl-diphosphatase
LVTVEILEAVLFGVVQGLTEFLPVSSSGHLALFNKLFGYAPEGSFLSSVVSVHVATLVAVVIVFWRDLLSLFTTNRKVILLLLLGTIPAGAVGLVTRDFFEDAGGNMVLVGAGFLTSALFLLLAGKNPGRDRELKDLSPGDSLAVGLAQALAILPGVSRSGSTISMARYRGAESTAAARFSFLLMIPAVGGAALLDAKELLTSAEQFNLVPTAVSFLAALGVSIVALRLLLGLLRRGRFSFFSYYLIPLAIATILYGLAAG